ncbi:MAG: DUF4430 domain-containing protein [Planctomycetales bacterium]|nr:DUF4430 domain-containing protein [Planctomycetales bacterium]
MTSDQASPDDKLSAGAIRAGRDGGGWALPALLAALVGVIATIGWIQRNDQPPGDSSPPHGQLAAEAWTPTPRPTGATVSLTIDFGNGARRQFDALPWHSGATIADAMQAARAFRPGIAYVQQGEGAAAFVTALEGVESEGAGGRYWQILVNDEPINESMGAHAIEAGDRILWRFAPER